MELNNFTSSYKKGLVDPKLYDSMWVQVISMGGGQHDQLEMPKGAVTFFGNRKAVDLLYDGSHSETCRVNPGGENEMGEINLPSGKYYPGNLVLFDRVDQEEYHMVYAPWDSEEAETIRELSVQRFRLKGKGRQLGFIGDFDHTLNLPVRETIVNLNDYFDDSTRSLKTQVRRPTNQRIGQPVFRRRQEKLWDSRCALTGLKPHSRALRASHAKPWKYCEPGEHRNPYNGFLFLSNIDSLFDAGLITIDPDGYLVTSSLLNDDDFQILEIAQHSRIALSEAHLPFLTWHRENIFKP